MAVEAQTRAGTLGGDFIDAAEHAVASGQLNGVSDAELERVMTAAVRLYAAKAEGDTPPAVVAPERVTPTDVVVTVSALIRAVGLNLWDVSMWFNREKR
jgi:predicted neutral ceramidase superfamily lipid hydrolase